METFARWLPLKRGQELIILKSGHQFAATVEISSSFRFRFFFIFAPLHNVSTTLQYITKREGKKDEQKIA